MSVGFEIVLILVLVVLNGLFSMSEIAVLAARKARLKKRSDEGDAGARVALELAGAPDDFLATVQVGITLVGILAGALRGATVAEAVAGVIARIPALAGSAQPIALVLVVFALTYVSLVVGELVPKRVALSGPERIASAVARPMRSLARLASPAVRLLSGSTDLLVRLLGVRREEAPPITEEELRILIDLGTEAGTFERAERSMIDNVLKLGDRPVSAIMTPRTEIVFLDRTRPPEAVAETLRDTRHARYPVVDGDLERVVGIVRTRDLLATALSGAPIDLGAVMKPPVFVPESTRILSVLERFKETRPHLALVVDEYGGIEGLVTIHDVLQSIVGDLPAQGPAEPNAVRREDGSWLLDGGLDLEELGRLFPSLSAALGARAHSCHTLAGLVMWRLGRMPGAADHFEWSGVRFEVMDMDGRRVDKVLATALPTAG